MSSGETRGSRTAHFDCRIAAPSAHSAYARVRNCLTTFNVVRVSKPRPDEVRHVLTDQLMMDISARGAAKKAEWGAHDSESRRGGDLRLFEFLSN